MLQRALRDAPEGLPQVSTFTILHTIHEASKTLRKRNNRVEESHDEYTREKTVIERAYMKQCPPAPEVVPEGKRWQDWDIYPAAEQLDRFFPPVRMLLIWDDLVGHRSRAIVQWCAEHGILLLSTPNAGSWLNMAESVQRIIRRDVKTLPR